MPINGRFLHGPRRKMLCLSKRYLFVQCWGGGKGWKPAPLLEGVFQHETFCRQLSTPLQKSPPLSDIAMLYCAQSGASRLAEKRQWATLPENSAHIVLSGQDGVLIIG